MTPYHSQYWAHLLTLKGAGGSIENLTRSISNARVDLNPHQVDAALFALRSPLSRGAILADEVGLGKTIEAGIVLAQRWAERKRRILLIVPATLRKQWQQELEEKFFLPATVIDSVSFNRLQNAGQANPFVQDDKIIICSYHFASAKANSIQGVPWDLVCIDEAHRLRNVYRPQSRMARRITDSIGPAHKLLLTATPLQNSLMELYGLVSIIDEHVFGDAASFRDQFVKAGNETDRNNQLRNRLMPVCIRTLRSQVLGYISYTNRIPITQDFTPSDDEQQLYESVSAFLQRENLISLPASQRQLITLVLRKLLASSTFAIAGTLQGLVARLRIMKRELERVRLQTSVSNNSIQATPTKTPIFPNEATTQSVSELIDEGDFESILELEDEWESDDEEVIVEEVVPEPQIQVQKPTIDIDPKALDDELNELLGFSQLASRITANAKGEALLPALDIAFKRADEFGAARKAVIFTESRRTQQYLFELLSQRGFANQLVLMNGTNTDPISKDIYQRWVVRHAGEPCISGSKPVDIKAAIVEEFRDSASILIATEAAAEGVNLQFCSLVVNFDLPWNPQRIEQRIGRCHRYGQKHDVVVVNFLNRRNEADQRVFEILSEKFRLFDGVFGSSDEILGALESGVDIERRIASVYQECRTPEEIVKAFDELQMQLNEQIQIRMDGTRQTLLENFDEEVAERLRVHRDKTLESLSDRERWLLALTRTELGTSAEFDSHEPRFSLKDGFSVFGFQFSEKTSNAESPKIDSPKTTYHFDWKKAEKNNEIFYRQQHPLAVHLIELATSRQLPPAALNFHYGKYGSIISVLEPLLGQSGWLELSKLTITSLDTEEFLVLNAWTDLGQIVNEEIACKLFSLPADCEELSVSSSQCSKGDESIPTLLKTESLKAENLQTLVTKRVNEVEQRNMKHFDEEVLKLDHWSDDLKQGLEREIKELDKQIREARKVASLATSLNDKLEAQKLIRTLEATRKDQRKRLFEAQDEIDTRRDELIANIEVQLDQKKTISPVFTIRWRLGA